MKIDLTAAEIREAITFFLKTKGMTVKTNRYVQSFSRNQETTQHNMRYNAPIQLLTACFWGGEVTGATVEIEDPPERDVPPQDPYRAP